MTNKYLEKIAVSFIVEDPIRPENKYVVSRKEHDAIEKDTHKNWTGKRALGYSALNAGVGAVAGNYIGQGLGYLAGGHIGGYHGRNVGRIYGAILGAASGLNHSHNVSKSEAIKKHFKEED